MRSGSTEGVAPLIRVQDLSVSYASGDHIFPALRGVSLDVGEGEVAGILGESGSGKTTLGLTLLRLLPANARIESGSVRFREVDLLTAGEREMQKIRGAQIAMVAQEPELALHPDLTARRQIEEVIAAHRSWSPRERRDHITRMLSEVRLPEGLSSAYPHQLSGGERQRLVIAMALACRPALLIGDEPTASLDVILKAQWLALMKQLQQQMRMAILLITHDPAILAGWADQVLVMHAGVLVEAGGSDEVLGNPLHPYTRALLQSVPPLPGKGASQSKYLPVMTGASGVQPPQQGCSFEPRCNERTPMCAQRCPPETRHGGRRVRCFLYGE